MQMKKDTAIFHSNKLENENAAETLTDETPSNLPDDRGEH